MNALDWCKLLVVLLVANCAIWAQEEVAEAEEPIEAEEVLSADDAHKPEPVPPPVVALPKPASVAEMLSGSSLSKGCVEDFANILGKGDFDMMKFAKELPPAVAKVKLQLKSPFGKPNDSDKTDAGLTVGCIKALPESPAEIQSLLKDISLRMGLSFVAESVTDNSIPANVGAESGSGGGVLKTVISIGLVAGGLGGIVYGLLQDKDVQYAVDYKNGKKAVDAEKRRNIGYGVGAALLACGITVYIVF